MGAEEQVVEEGAIWRRMETAVDGERGRRRVVVVVVRKWRGMGEGCAVVKVRRGRRGRRGRMWWWMCMLRLLFFGVVLVLCRPGVLMSWFVAGNVVVMLMVIPESSKKSIK